METSCWMQQLLLLLLVTTVVHISAINTPEYVIPCSRRDPEINNCLKKAFNHLRPYLARGIPELSVPPMEPFLIPRLAMENGNGAVRVRAVFSNMTIAGSNNYSIAWIKSDVSNYRIDLGLNIPKIETTGKYDVSGNVLLFPVRSRGDYYAAFYDIASISKIVGREVTLQDGRKYMKIERLYIDFNLNKSRFKIRDYLNSGNVIGEAMNQFLNQNADEIIKEMKPVAASTIAKYLKDILNSAFLKIPVEVWLRD